MGVFDFDIGAYPTLHINARELSDLVEARGHGAELRRATLCPCMRIETNQPRAGCKACGGVGFSYPKDGREPIVVLITSREARARALAAGRTYAGTAKATFPIGIIPSRGDMIRPDCEFHVAQQVLHRGVQQVDPRTLAARRTSTDQLPPPGGPRVERLIYPDAGEIESVHYIGADGELVHAYLDHDYTRPMPDRIEWLAGRGPEPGKGYTVRYHAPAAYVVGEAFPAVRNEGGGEDYPYAAQLTRLDRWGTPDLDSSED